MKPQYIIKKFSGMWENWLFWCEGFSPEMSWWDINLVNNIGMGDRELKTTTWFTTYENSKAMQQFFVDDSRRVVTRWEKMMHVFWLGWPTPFQLHDCNYDSWEVYTTWRFWDLATTKEWDLLYTMSCFTWRWYRANATAASATTLVDDTKDFWYSIYSSRDEYWVPMIEPSLTTGNNKVTNLTKGKEYTVTSIWFTNSVFADVAGSYASTYAVPAAISETAANMNTWIPLKNITSQIWVWMVAKGSWTVTITVHDSLNTVLSTFSISTAFLTDWAMNYFYCPAFKAYWQNLHFHITSTGTTTIKSNSANDLSTASFNIRIGDTLNFASATPTPQVNDDFMLFVDKKYSFEDDANEVNYPSFSNQQARFTFKRQIKQYDNEFFIANGNWMSSLSGEAFSAWAKRMPDNHQLVALGINGSNILFSCDNLWTWKLLLWDWHSGWLDAQWLPTPAFSNILDIDLSPYALENYNNGWTFVSNWVLYFTDWWSIKPLSSVPDSNSIWRTSFNTLSFNWLKLYNNKLIMAIQGDTGNRVTSGIYIYDFNWNWTYQPIRSSQKNQYWELPYTLFYINDWQTDYASNYPKVYTWSDKWIHSLSWYWNEWNFIYKLKLWEKRRLSMVRLNLTKTDSLPLQTNTNVWYYDITCSYGKGKIWILTSLNTTSNTTSTITVSWLYSKIETWSEVMVLTWYAITEPIWERTFIQSKTGEGTATEVWAISPALSAATSWNTIKCIDVKKAWTKVVSAFNLNEICDFDLKDFYGDTLVLEFVFKGTSTSNIWVSSIEIY